MNFPRSSETNDGSFPKMKTPEQVMRDDEKPLFSKLLADSDETELDDLVEADLTQQDTSEADIDNAFEIITRK